MLCCILYTIVTFSAMKKRPYKRGWPRKTNLAVIYYLIVSEIWSNNRGLSVCILLLNSCKKNSENNTK